MAQRYHYLLSGIQWFSDVLTLVFTALLVVTGSLLLAGHPIHLPVLGTTLALLPLAFWGMGITRTLWALRATRRCTFGEAFGAMVILWSLSWVVALACLQGVLRRNGVFLRTPKAGKAALLHALRSTLSETVLAAACWTVGVLVLMHSGQSLHLGLWWSWGASSLVLGLCALAQGAVYASAPLLCLLSLRTEGTARAVRRRAYDAEGGTGEWRLLAGALALAGVISLIIFGTVFLPGSASSGADHTQALTQLLGPGSGSAGVTAPTATPGKGPAPNPTRQPGTTPTAISLTPTATPRPGKGNATPTPAPSVMPTATPHPGATPNPGTPQTPHPHPTQTPHPHP